MPRANRYILPGHIWRVPRSCHKQKFLLKFVKDRRAWLYWLYQTRRRLNRRGPEVSPWGSGNTGTRSGANLSSAIRGF